MGTTCGMYGGKERCVCGFCGETWWRPRCTQEDNIKMDLSVSGMGGMD